MVKSARKPSSHPDDFMTVTVALAFNAKVSPTDTDAPRLGTTETEITLPATEASEYLERVLTAIRGRWLYGLMAMEAAGSLVDTKEWVRKTTEEVLAEMGSADGGGLRKPRLPHLSSVRRDA